MRKNDSQALGAFFSHRYDLVGLDDLIVGVSL